MRDKEHSPEITIRLNPGCKKDGIMHILAFSIILFRVKNVKSCNYKLRSQRSGAIRFELYHTEKVLKSKEMNFSKQHA